MWGRQAGVVWRPQLQHGVWRPHVLPYSHTAAMWGRSTAVGPGFPRVPAGLGSMRPFGLNRAELQVGSFGSVGRVCQQSSALLCASTAVCPPPSLPLCLGEAHACCWAACCSTSRLLAGMRGSSPAQSCLAVGEQKAVV